MTVPARIVSGGQTGADRAGLDWAIKRGVDHGGWCPKGRKALDGPLPARYQMRETPSDGYLQRNEWNVRDSDGTVVFTLATTATGGSWKTLEFARKLERPGLHIHPGLPDPALRLATFVRMFKVRTLNIAGSRASKEPGLYEWVHEVLNAAFPDAPA